MKQAGDDEFGFCLDDEESEEERKGQDANDDYGLEEFETGNVAQFGGASDDEDDLAKGIKKNIKKSLRPVNAASKRELDDLKRICEE